ncbi:uncharacterized protein LOC144453811 [Glandiceps talaboti]
MGTKLLVVILSVITMVYSDGTLELQLVTFSNREGQLSNGDKCDDVNGDECDTQMDFCLTSVPYNIDNECSYGNESTGILGGDNIDFASGQSLGNGLSNPIEFPFFGEWPSQFVLVIHVNDEDDDGDELIDKYLNNVQIEPGTSQQSAVWKSLVTTGDSGHTQMASQVKVYCAENWYDRHCNTYCFAQPEDTFTCDYQTGSKTCKLGWAGPDCNVALCTTGCHPIHGSCTQPRECICEENWTGRLCDECIRSEGCVNGFCIAGNDCHCHDDTWSGELCDIDLNSCRNTPCENGGSCTNTGPDAYSCECVDGFIGENCETDVNECESSPCLNGGNCLDFQGYYECECNPGFEGVDCEIEINHCFVESPDGKLIPTGVCGAYGTCVNTPTTFRCECHEGFQGLTCDENIDDCADNDCKHGSTCVDGVAKYHCECAPGWEGHHCQRDIDECASGPCENGGTCIDEFADFTCLCPKGWEGKDCSVGAPEDCLVDGKGEVSHGSEWEDECNGCFCTNGDTQCSKIWCGPDNCLAYNKDLDRDGNKVIYTCPPDAPCTLQPEHECLLGHCKLFGECYNHKKDSVQDARCGTSSFDDKAGTYACTYVGMRLDYDILPMNSSVEDVCYELRRIKDLRPHAMDDRLVILCDKDIESGQDNVIYVSLESGSGPGVTEDAMNEMIRFIQALPQESDNLILKSIYDIFIPKDSPQYSASSDIYIWLPILLVLLLLCLVAIVIFAVWYRRRKQKQQKHIDHPLSRLTLKMRENPFFEEKDEVEAYGMTTYVPNHEQCSSADADYELDVISLSSQSDHGCEMENQKDYAETDHDYMTMENNPTGQLPPDFIPRRNDGGPEFV